MNLTPSDIETLTELRQKLHRYPEISGQEIQTARRITDALAEIGGCEIVTGLGGHGVAAIFESPNPGPSVMLRAELDALLIQELGNPAYKSLIDGKSHMCGHDGHMATLIGCAVSLAKNPPEQGRVVLMFQPAEEDGSGAAAVIADERFERLRCDYAYSWHNFPGLKLGETQIRSGPLFCASVGVQIRFKGRTAHASQPENGNSPAQPLAQLIQRIVEFTNAHRRDETYKLVTITYANLGEPTFGVAAGESELRATLRAVTSEGIQELRNDVENLARNIAVDAELEVDFAYFDDFATSINDPEATETLIGVCDRLGVNVDVMEEPFAGSEDFGRFGQHSKAAMILIGAGDTAALHNPDYDFPDELIPTATSIMMAAARTKVGTK